MDEEGIMYLAFTLVILIIALSLVPYIGKGILTIIGLLIIIAGIFIIVALNFADYLFVSLVFGLLGITFEPAQGYKITKDQKAILKNVNGLFYATGFISANLFAYSFKSETPESETESKLITSPESWELAVMNLGFPFKFHVLSMGLDVQKVRDEWEGKRSYQEFQLSRAMQSTNTNEVAITNIQRNINVIQQKIDRISQGEKPIATLMYVETTAIGVSEKAALDLLSQQIENLQVSLSTMDVDLVRIIGRELYTLFDFNFSLPITYEETRQFFDQQS